MVEYCCNKSYQDTMPNNQNSHGNKSEVWGLLFIGLQCERIGYRNPINCAYLECPEYEVVHSEAKFEIRVYKDANWMSFPVISSTSFKDASTKGFLKLFDYINGKNKDGRNISITAPVLVDIGTSTGSSPYVVYYYIPKEYQLNPPIPVSKLYKPVNLPPKQFAAVRRFSGFSNDSIIQKQSSFLKRYLKGTSWESASEVQFYSQAGYNAPYELDNRVNEIFIWFD